MTPDQRRDPRTFAIIGAAMHVHRELGPELLESLYGDCLEIEFDHRAIPYVREFPMQVHYRGLPVRTPFRADFLCYGAVVVELKAMACIGKREVGQVAHYLAIANAPLGLLINFGASSLEFERVIPRSHGPGRRPMDTPQSYSTTTEAVADALEGQQGVRAPTVTATSYDRPW
jgi:GxxExxY protein